LTNLLGQFAQSLLFNRANVWSTIAPKMVDRLAAIRRKNQPIYFVPNFLNRSMEAAIAEHASKLGRLPAKPPKLLYAGNIGKKQDLLAFCQRLSQASLEFKFRIHGDGGEAHHIREWVDRQHDGRFQFGEFLDEKGFVAALFEADLFVITEKPQVGASFIPSKLIPCIATGTPVLCVCDGNGPLGNEVNSHRLGLAMEWSDVEQLQTRLSALLADGGRFVDLQRNTLKRAGAYGRSPILELVDAELRRLAVRPSSHVPRQRVRRPRRRPAAHV
jgi:colanic acid biosynthesis glycosyl transferase WcaI